ncbi:hypothetical protein [Colwellia sp. RSH04]|uniref:hypothetical protein n=1 Tax=Colwellia sp. RSH04 TaxID=2305464 RepID=UPI0011C23D1C|nr:hypothetical protein [Colwellia sp. RSH04]
MSKGTKTKNIIKIMRRYFWFASFSIVILLSSYQLSNQDNITVNNSDACLNLTSSLPMNHYQHPCHKVTPANHSWLSWFSGDSQSAQLHMLDLIELIHYSFD